MSKTLAARQRAWVAALLRPENGTEALSGWAGGVRSPEQGFAVYVNNVRANVLHALAQTFPATQALVGVAAFRRAVLASLREQPPRSGDLGDYGAALPSLVGRFARAGQECLTTELARYEWTLDALPRGFREPAWTLERAAQVPPERWPLLRLRPVAQSVLFTAPVPVSGWVRHLLHADPEPLLRPERCLLVAGDAEVSILPLTPPAQRWLETLARSESLEAATAAALTLDPEFSLPSWLGELLAAQALTQALPAR